MEVSSELPSAACDDETADTDYYQEVHNYHQILPEQTGKFPTTATQFNKLSVSFFLTFYFNTYNYLV